MSVVIPTVVINTVPMPQFTPRSRREDSARDVVNARNIEAWRSSAPIRQPLFRPAPSGDFDPRRNASYIDQAGIATRYKQPVSLPAPSFDPNASKLAGNPYFDQHAPEFDPRNVARELRATVKETKSDRGIIESQRILQRGFSSRNLPEGFAETRQFDSLQAFELLRPKIDDVTHDYRKYT